MENNTVNNQCGGSDTIQWHEEVWDLSRLKKFERNPRRISSKQRSILKKAIEELGFHTAINVQPDGTIISGHQRLEALRDIGHTTARVSLPSRTLTDDEFKRMLIQCNINNGAFDIPMLLLDYKEEEMEDWGAEDMIMKAFRKTNTPSNADDIVPIASVAVTRPGDTWILGAHRLRCGDSTNAQDVAALLAGAVPHLMVTDPPYGVSYDAAWRDKVVRSDGSKVVRSDGSKVGARAIGKVVRSDGSKVGARAIGKVENDDRSDWRQAWALFPGEVAYIWHAGRHASNVQSSLEACGFDIRAQIIWAKNHIAIGRGHYHWQHEPCWYAVREGGTGHWQGDRTQSTLWAIDKPQKSETGHSTQKPVECMKRPIENNSVAGDSIYEPFSGSGTTIIAAELTGRACYAMELNALYVDMAVSRWQHFSGKTATLEATGEAFTTPQV